MKIKIDVLQVTFELVASAQALAVQTTSRKTSCEKYAVIFKLNYEKLQLIYKQHNFLFRKQSSYPCEEG